MNCEQARKSLSLLLYGDLSFEEEEQVELHLDVCESCRTEREREARLHAILDRQAVDPPPELLRQARQGLRLRVQEQARRRGSFWDFFQIRWAPMYLRPVGALALLAAGFFGARLTNVANTGMFRGASLLAEPVTSRVRYVEPEPSGEVQIVVDETRQRILSGRLDEDRIRRLLLSAAKDPADPGLRVESVGILNARCQSEDVRSTLVYVLQHDPNSGVRLKALAGLRPYAGDAEVRKALIQVLLADDNPGLRQQAIDLLTASKEQHQLAGVLQELLRKEDNNYVRLRCEKALQEMNASVETY
jgi:hypothetical protein